MNLESIARQSLNYGPIDPNIDWRLDSSVRNVPDWLLKIQRFNKQHIQCIQMFKVTGYNKIQNMYSYFQS